MHIYVTNTSEGILSRQLMILVTVHTIPQGTSLSRHNQQ